MENAVTYEFKTRPFEHQKEAIRRARGRAGFGFFMEMGTGKTKAAIDEMGILHDEGEIDCAIIFAPKGVYRNWVRELEIHMGADYVAEYWVPGGGNNKQKSALRKICEPSNKLRILIVNIEAMSSTEVAYKFVRFFAKSGRCYCIVDESTTIKGFESVRTQNVIEIGKLSKFRRIATGSPAPNSPLDLYPQFEFLGSGLLGTTSHRNFLARHAIMKKTKFKFTRNGREMTKTKEVVVGYRNLSGLTERVQEHSFRVLKEDCLDLPPKMYRIVDADMTDEQASVYAQMREDAFAELAGGGFVTSSNAITMMLRLQQILCGHTKDADGDLRLIKSNRTNILMDELEGVSGGVIIWSRFIPEIDDIVGKLRENYGEASVAVYTGQNTHTREAEAVRYVNDDKCRFMVSTQQSGGYGNTWLKGVNTFYLSNSFNLEHRLQSEDRSHRSGQKNNCTYTDLQTPGSVDIKLIRSLRAKISIAETILNDDPREWLI